MGERRKTRLKRAALIVLLALCTLSLPIALLTLASSPGRDDVLRAAVIGIRDDLDPSTPVLLSDKSLRTWPDLEMIASSIEELAAEIDFRLPIKSGPAIRQILTRSVFARSVSGSGLPNVSTKSNKEIDAWENAKFSGIGPKGISVRVSQPGFVNKDLALVYVEWWGGGVYAGGEMLVIEHSKPGWQMIQRITLWQS